jgi:hypothetical protein
MGFYTTRFVEAANPAAAEYAAVDVLRVEGKLTPLNDGSDPPKVFVGEVEEIDREEVPSIAKGFTFFPDDVEPNA